MNHVFYERDDGLAHCRVCSGAEGSLPTECPGRRMTAQEQDEVMAGELNFSNRKWWSPKHAAQVPLPAAHEPNAKLLELADRIDPEQLWRKAVIGRDKMTAEQEDRMRAAVFLRRYADLLGNGGWRVYPPRPGVCFRAGTLDRAVEMARKDEARRES